MSEDVLQRASAILAEVLQAAALNRAKLKRAGLDDYDLKILRPVFQEINR